jgi:hypothetical protein
MDSLQGWHFAAVIMQRKMMINQQSVNNQKDRR